MFYGIDFYKAHTVQHNDETGEIKIEESEFKFIEYEHFETLKDIKQLTHQHYEEMRTFLRFYGPTEFQYKKYLEETDQKSDPRWEYVQLLIDCWFVQRSKLKISNLHTYLLD